MKQIVLEQKQRLEYLDGLRAIAALTVIFTHAFFCVWFGNGHGGGANVIYHLLFGSTAVVFFIVLSGFCLTLPVAETLTLTRGPLDFYRRRAKRILPPYFACLAVSLALIVSLIGPDPDTLWNQTGVITWHGIWTHLLLLHDITGDRTINYPLWTIAVEWRIYFLFPLILWAWRRFGLLSSSLGFIVLSYGLYLLICRTSYAEGSPHFIGLFVLGGWAAAAPRLPRRPVFLSLMVLLPLLAIQAWGGLSSHLEGYGLWVLLVGAAFALLLAGLAEEPTHWLRRTLSWRPLVTVGVMSYSVYLMHAPLLEVICKRFLFPFQIGMMARDRMVWPLESFALLIVVGVPIILLWSLLFYLVFEKRSWMSRLVFSRPDAQNIDTAPPRTEPASDSLRK